jgi:hypothetical protein
VVEEVLFLATVAALGDTVLVAPVAPLVHHHISVRVVQTRTQTYAQEVITVLVVNPTTIAAMVVHSAHKDPAVLPVVLRAITAHLRLHRSQYVRAVRIQHTHHPTALHVLPAHIHTVELPHALFVQQVITARLKDNHTPLTVLVVITALKEVQVFLNVLLVTSAGPVLVNNLPARLEHIAPLGCRLHVQVVQGTLIKTIPLPLPANPVQRGRHLGQATFSAITHLQANQQDSQPQDPQCNQLHVQLGSQHHDLVRSQVDSQRHCQVDSLQCNRLHSLLVSQRDDRQDSLLCNQLHIQLGSQHHDLVRSQVDSQRHYQVDNHQCNRPHNLLVSQRDDRQDSLPHNQLDNPQDSLRHCRVHNQVDSQRHYQVDSLQCNRLHILLVSQQVGRQGNLRHNQLHIQVGSQHHYRVHSQVDSLQCNHHLGLLLSQPEDRLDSLQCNRLRSQLDSRQDDPEGSQQGSQQYALLIFQPHSPQVNPHHALAVSLHLVHRVSPLALLRVNPLLSHLINHLLGLLFTQLLDRPHLHLRSLVRKWLQMRQLSVDKRCFLQ